MSTFICNFAGKLIFPFWCCSGNEAQGGQPSTSGMAAPLGQLVPPTVKDVQLSITVVDKQAIVMNARVFLDKKWETKILQMYSGAQPLVRLDSEVPVR